jgi:hypothetical protein
VRRPHLPLLKIAVSLGLVAAALMIAIEITDGFESARRIEEWVVVASWASAICFCGLFVVGGLALHRRSY